MIVTAWNNGSPHESGAGYGLKVSIEDRNRYFDRMAKKITIELPSGSRFDVNTAKKSFWSATCRELISKEIGEWLLQNGFAPWPKGHPPKFILTPQGPIMKLSAPQKAA